MDPFIWSSKSRIRGEALRTCRMRWRIGRGGERGPGISALMAQQDDDEVQLQMLFEHSVYIVMWGFRVGCSVRWAILHNSRKGQLSRSTSPRLSSLLSILSTKNLFYNLTNFYTFFNNIELIYTSPCMRWFTLLFIINCQFHCFDISRHYSSPPPVSPAHVSRYKIDLFSINNNIWDLINFLQMYEKWYF